MGFSRQECWSGLPFPSPLDHILSDLSTMTHCLGWPHTAWLSFIELEKAVVLWSDWLVYYDYGFSESDALSQHLPSYLVFSYLGREVSLHGCSSKAQPLLLTLDEGYLLTAAPPDLESGAAPLTPPAPHSSHSLEVGLELISEFSKVAGYKILAFPYSNNEKSEREIKESIPLQQKVLNI